MNLKTVRKAKRKIISLTLVAVMLVQCVLSHLTVWADDNVYLEFIGYQISATLEGYRTLYSIADPAGKTEEVGLVYGLTDYVTDDDMVVGSTNSTVYSYAGTSEGIASVKYSDYEGATTYVRTMKFIDDASFYNTSISIRAYAKLQDGSYIYSDINTMSVYRIASILYNKCIMSNISGHEYLYNNILTVVNPSYATVDYNWGSVVVPAQTTAATEETTATEEETTTVIDDTAPYIVVTNGDGSIVDSSAVTYDKASTPKVLTINEAGTYILSNSTSAASVEDTAIVVAGGLMEEVNLTWNNLVIDNSSLGSQAGQDVSLFTVGESTTNVNVTLKGQSVFTGNSSYTEAPVAAIICADDKATTLTFTAADSTAGLTVIDSMPSDTDMDGNDPTDGIFCKGTLEINSGVYRVTSNGDCLKGTGKKGAGGITINGGTYTLKSNLSNGLKSKNGIITINAGTINCTYTKEDAVNAKNYDVIITGGTLNIDNCYGDGIQGENVNVSGDSTVIDIKTYYEYAGKNFYNSELGSGNYNTLTSTGSSKTEVVNVDTGSHKGIKGGTKYCTFSYASVEDGSDYVAGTTYTQEASGGIVISGGTITIDTTNTGIKYNGSSGMGGMFGHSTTTGSGNLSAANNDGQYIIGSPDDGIHSNNTCVISGGKINIASSDDGITARTSMIFSGDCDVKISQCYEGIEGGEIIIGSSDNAADIPNIKVYSDDDGVNAASDSTVNYAYTDETEEQYTKSETSASGNNLYVYSGYLNVMIGDDVTHSFSLPMGDGTTTTSTYSSNGDGIDCNGSFYAYGGTIIVYGANTQDNSPIDTDNTYHIGSGVTILAVGAGMITSPTSKDQAVVTNSSSSSGGMGGMGGMRPGQSGSSGSTSSGAFAVFNSSGTALLSIQPPKSYSYVLYSSPEITSGSSYTLYTGGSVSGGLINSDSEAYDYRYTGYSTSGATSSTVTAS